MELHKLLTLLIHFYLCIVNISSIYIKDNAYKGIYITISERVDEEDFKFEKLKTILTKSSELAYHATRKRSYFGEFIIFFPSSWTAEVCGKQKPPSEIFRKTDIHLTDANRDPLLITKHSGGCGLEGDRIDLPLKWMNENTEIASLAHKFVQQWSIYRYGVFEEKPITEDSCYLSGKSWTPVGCYNIKYNYSEPSFENGLPTCSLPGNFSETKGLRSSLMSEVSSSKVFDFCDGSSSFPHNPAMPTFHNALCKGKTVWSIIENSPDFKHGVNRALKNDKPPKNPEFKCFREESVHVTFAIQTNTVANLEIDDMSQIGSALYEFLRNMVPRDSKITGVTFSDEEDSQQQFELEISNPTKLYDTLQYRVKTLRKINSVCLTCGLQKALNATREFSSSFPIVVVIAWKSALINEDSSELVQSIKEYPSNVRLHLVLVEDTKMDSIPIGIIQSIRSLGGLIYSLPKERVFRASKLLAILATVVKIPTQVEDRIVVVHEKNYRNINKNFVDSFIIPTGEFRKMLYIMYCSPKLDSIIYSNNTNCTSSIKTSDSTFKCSEVWDFNNKKASNKWEYPFTYFGTSGPLHCSSVAMLLTTSSAKHSSTLKGWLSNYLVKVPQNVLIIYAEITGFPEQQFKVEAQISGPGLKSPISLEIRDNGNGDPDTKAGDRIYSRYFTNFSEKGLYTVTVSAEQLMNYASSLSIIENLDQMSGLVLNKTIGFFYVNDPVPKLDTLPPNRVADLSVVSINQEDRTAVLQWTAPGGDYDYGKANAYEIKYSLQPSSLSDLYFNQPENFLLQPFHGNQSIKPINNGDKERFEFQFPKTQNSVVYYVAFRAIDGNNNMADISNIIQVYFSQFEKEMTMKSTISTAMTSQASSDTTSSDMVNNTNDVTEGTSQTTYVTESSILPDNTTISLSDNEFFDKKTTIILSSSGGFILLIIIINIIICCCCIKKMKQSPKPRKLSRKDSLRPPYNLNIAFQEDDRQSSSNTDNFIGVSMSTLADPNDYTEPETQVKPSGRKYSYHTEKSLQNKTKKDSELGFKVIQALPAYATSSLSRYGAKSREPDTESETDFKSAIPQPQVPSGVQEAQIYPLGVV